MTKQIKMSMQHERVWNELRTLKDGERILGPQLRTIAGIEDERRFFNIIEDLRTLGLAIGASKNEPKGYFEIRTQHDMASYLNTNYTELKQRKKVLDTMRKRWEKEQKEGVK